MVLGVAGDFGYNGVNKNWLTDAGAYNTKLEGRYSGSLRARAGYLLNQNTLLYATGGWAFMNVKMTGDDVPPVGNKVTQTKTLNGFTIGAGVEYKITQNISINTEYRYTDYQKTSITKFSADASVKTRSQDIRIGINYRF